MQIVIDVPDRIYKFISQNRILNITDSGILVKAVRNGTPLPEEHGRLIDTDKLRRNFNTALREKDIHTDAGILEVLGDLLDNASIIVKGSYE